MAAILSRGRSVKHNPSTPPQKRCTCSTFLLLVAGATAWFMAPVVRPWYVYLLQKRLGVPLQPSFYMVHIFNTLRHCKWSPVYRIPFWLEFYWKRILMSNTISRKRVSQVRFAASQYKFGQWLGYVSGPTILKRTKKNVSPTLHWWNKSSNVCGTDMCILRNMSFNC